jgi:replicative DNA helicase
MSDVSRTLKLMAKELSIPVVCLAQLSRRTEDRDKKIPVLSDLRESGAIEQDSDVCMFLSRPSLYDQYDKPGIVEVRVLKNRHGETKHFDLIFKGETQEFGNIDKTVSPINVID